MLNVFKRELRANLKSVLIWAVVMIAMAAIGFGEYGMVMGEGTNMDIAGVVNLMPRVLQVMFGMGAISISTPEGWYVCMFLWCALIAYIFAALHGAGILSKEERDKTAEFLYTKPIKRSTVITAKLLVTVIDTFIVVFVGWAATSAVFVPQLDGADLMGYITVSMIGMFLTALVFLLIGLCFSAVFTGRGKAAQYSAITVIGTYLLSVMIEMVGDIDFLNFLTPFKYFDAVRVLDNGLEPLYILLAAALVAIAGALTYVLYGKRNLHS